ncbi:hypothetical protein SEPCBS57363_001006 [Sporothrix epigloea]|uniref:Selenoprotein W family protein n=1 Tax=Sporothrix epigloea TaxID=1892477 RepID=A0ABP0D849_9PEZI
MAATLPTGGSVAEQASAPRLPRVTIQFCTQCKWMLRAAYVAYLPTQFAQELLSTFGPALGEVALQPATGGVFTVAITETADAAAASGGSGVHLLWDRKAEGGFPETKELKRRVRNVIEPGRDLGHVDRDHGKSTIAPVAAESESEAGARAGTSAPVSMSTAAAASQVTTASPAPFCKDCQ